MKDAHSILTTLHEMGFDATLLLVACVFVLLYLQTPNGHRVLRFFKRWKQGSSKQPSRQEWKDDHAHQRLSDHEEECQQRHLQINARLQSLDEHATRTNESLERIFSRLWSLQGRVGKPPSDFVNGDG